MADLSRWDASPEMEAAELAELLTIPTGADGWTPRPLRLADTRITGPLDLEAAVLTRPLHLEDCLLEEHVTLTDAQAITIRFTGCHLPTLDARALHTRGDLLLNRGFVSTGEVNLTGAHVGGTLNCDDATFANAGGIALNADLLAVAASLSLRRSTCEGELRLPGVRIAGEFDATGATLINDAGPALTADGLQVDLQVLWGDLIVRAASPTGAVRLWNVRVGALHAVGAWLTNSSGPALNGDNLRVERDLFLQNVAATGSGVGGVVRLASARIGGEMDASGAQLHNESGPAFDGKDLQVAQDVLLRGCQFVGVGEYGRVRLPGAHVGGQLSFSGDGAETVLSNDSGPALHADRLRVGDGLFLWQGLKLTGTGKVGALTLRDTRVGMLALDLGAIKDPTGAPGLLRVDGLSYSGPPVGASVADWLDVLAHRTPRYTAQPYQQLASTLRAVGDDGSGRKVLIAQRRDQLDRRALKGTRQRLWTRFTGLTLGYGYQPWRALLLLLCIAAIAVGMSLAVGSNGGLAHPANGSACTAVERIGVGLDLSLPLIKSGAREACATTDSTSGDLVIVVGWILQLAAWALATLFVAGFTGAVRKS